MKNVKEGSVHKLDNVAEANEQNHEKKRSLSTESHKVPAVVQVELQNLSEYHLALKTIAEADEEDIVSPDVHSKNMDHIAVRLKEIAREPTPACSKVVLEIVTKDDVAAGSALSLVMEKDFRYHFQHPRFRFFTAYIVTLCNFLIYVEDPIAHSYRECSIPVIGHAYSFIVTKWTRDSYSLVKFLFWFIAILFGLVFGKIVIHKYFFSKYCLQFVTFLLSQD